MLGDWRYTVPTDNMFRSLCNDDNMAAGEFQVNKRKRNNTGPSNECSNEERVNVFLKSSTDEKLNFIFDELCSIRGNQDYTNKGMMIFQQSFQHMNEKLGHVIEVTNKNTNLLKTLAYKSIDQEARSRRNNLIFWGMSENYNENCFHIIRDFIKNHLDLDSDRMYLARAHRLGPRKIGHRNPRRPIIVNFRDFCDTDTIMSRTYMLKDTPFSVCYDLPKEINEARKILWDELKSIKARQPRAKVQIAYPAKLIVDGKIIRDEFPDWGEIIQKSRRIDFTHIDNNRMCGQSNELNTMQDVCQQSVNSTIITHVKSINNNNESRDCFMNENRDTRRPVQEKSSFENISESNSDTQQHGTAMETQQDGELPVARTASSDMDKSDSNGTRSELFRPFDTATTYVQNSRGSSRDEIEINKQPSLPDQNVERLSRPLQRGLRRAQSASLPRANTYARDSVENPSSINRQSCNSATKHSQSREQAAASVNTGSNKSQLKTHIDNEPGDTQDS